MDVRERLAKIIAGAGARIIEALLADEPTETVLLLGQGADRPLFVLHARGPDVGELATEGLEDGAQIGLSLRSPRLDLAS